MGLTNPLLRPRTGEGGYALLNGSDDLQLCSAHERVSNASLP
jgi:hypothetical protein